MNRLGVIAQHFPDFSLDDLGVHQQAAPRHAVAGPAVIVGGVVLDVQVGTCASMPPSPQYGHMMYMYIAQTLQPCTTHASATLQQSSTQHSCYTPEDLSLAAALWPSRP